MDEEARRSDLKRKSIYAYGSAYIFECRIKKIKGLSRLNKFLGIAGPLVLGGYLGSFGINNEHIIYLMILVGATGIPLLLLSAWAIVSDWDGSIVNLTDAMISNARNRNRIDQFLIDNKPTTSELYPEIISDYNAQSNQDLKQDISDKEKRMGLRYALRQYRVECIQCSTVPSSMKPTNCPVCGQF